VDNPLNSLLHLNKSHLETAAAVCSRAFFNDPLDKYLIPDDDKRKECLIHPTRYYLKLSLLSGQLYATSPRLEGIISWFSSQKELTFWHMLRCGFPFPSLKCGAGFVIRDTKLDMLCQKVKKRLAPTNHIYLALLAVDPQYQGQGYASKLLKPLLEKLDEQKLPCYLETTTEQNVSLYEHFGFRVKEELKIPHSNTKVWALLR
jgi:GNAT superfamily N-acetyltransferase